MLIKEFRLCKMNFLMVSFVVFCLLPVLLCLLFPSTSFAAEYNAYFGDSSLYGSSYPPYFGDVTSLKWHSDDIGGPVLDVSLQISSELINYVGSLPFEVTSQKTCSGNTLFPVYVIFGDHLRETINDRTDFSGFGANYYNTSFYYNSTKRYHFVEENSETGEGFAYLVIRANRNEPTSSNSNFIGPYTSDLAFSYLPYGGSVTTNVINNYLEVLAVETFCTSTEADDYVNNYIFQDTRPGEDSPVIDPEFPYSYDSGDSDNNEEIYDVVFNQNSSSYEPNTGDARTVLNWFVTFVGRMTTITDDPSDYRCNIMFYPNTTRMIKFDWNGDSSYNDIRFNACDNEFVYALNDTDSVIGGDSGPAFVQNAGSGTFFYVTLRGILWIACFYLVFKMLRSFYYYVYEIIAYSFNLGNTTEGSV